jgi:DUF4097 and DUF4098 domain-containing protein YvlB
MRYLAVLAPIALVLSIGCPDGGARYIRTETRTLPLKAEGELRVKGFNGQIRVETWDREEVSVEAEIRENEQGEVEFKAESQDGRAEITARRTRGGEERGFHFNFGSAGVGYVLKVPAKVRATLETNNGEICARGLNSQLEVRTSNGRVELRDLGAGVTAHTSNGSIELDAIAGSAEVTTSNGSVEARMVKGDLRITTSNGSVEARDVEGRTTLRTSNASVVLERMKAPVVADTSNGSLRAEGLQDDLRASTSNASVELVDVAGKVDVHTTHGTIDARGLDGKGRGVRLVTSNADITLSLGDLKGQIQARTSHHNPVQIHRQGLATTGNPEKGEAEISIPGSTQPIELRTSHGTISIQ